MLRESSVIRRYIFSVVSIVSSVVWFILCLFFVWVEMMMVFLMLINIYSVISMVFLICFYMGILSLILVKFSVKVFSLNIMIVSIINVLSGNSFVRVVIRLMLVVVCMLCRMRKWIIQSKIEVLIIVCQVLLLLNRCRVGVLVKKFSVEKMIIKQDMLVMIVYS